MGRVLSQGCQIVPEADDCLRLQTSLAPGWQDWDRPRPRCPLHSRSHPGLCEREDLWLNNCGRFRPRKKRGRSRGESCGGHAQDDR